MRNTYWIFTLLLTGTLAMNLALAADAPTSTDAAKLETISGKSANQKKEHDDCLMHADKKKCDHKEGEPCPLHKKEHHNKKHEHEKCDHEHNKK